MSNYFTGGDNQAPEQTTPPVDAANPVDYVAEVIKAKGTHWDSPQEIAKGYLASQTYIGSLEKQTLEMRAELDKQDYSAELLKQLKDQGKPPVVDNPSALNDSVKTEHTAPTLSEDELKNLIESTLTTRETEATKTSNLRQVDEKLGTLFGTEVDKVMDKRSVELGMSKVRLQELAAESPNAFFQLMGEPQATATPPTPNSVLNTSVGSFTQATGERNWDYYQKLKKADRHSYFKPAIQRQLLADKMRLGDNFGNK